MVRMFCKLINIQVIFCSYDINLYLSILQLVGIITHISLFLHQAAWVDKHYYFHSS